MEWILRLGAVIVGIANQVDFGQAVGTVTRDLLPLGLALGIYLLPAMVAHGAKRPPARARSHRVPFRLACVFSEAIRHAGLRLNVNRHAGKQQSETYD